MKTKQTLSILSLLVVSFACSPGHGSETREEQATEAAKQWLALVDAGDYEKSWDEAATYFRAAITRERWAATLKGVRSPLGKAQEREVKTRQFATELPGAPDGEYVVIQFATRFDAKANAIETVTPMLNEDGEWRVSGYFIK